MLAGRGQGTNALCAAYIEVVTVSPFMAEVRLAFDGQCHSACSAYGFVVRAGGMVVGRGWGAEKAGAHRLHAALRALECGLEFVSNSPLWNRSLVAQSDASDAIDAVLGGGAEARRVVVSEDLGPLIGQFDALRFERVASRENAEARALARLGLAHLELRDRAFEISDDHGLTEYVTQGAVLPPSPSAGRAAPWTDVIPDLPLAPDELRRILERLPFRDREMIRLRYGWYKCGTLTYSEIGRVFRISGGRVAQIVKRGMQRFWAVAIRFDRWL